MKSSTYLRIASVLTLVHAILHTVGGVFGKPSPGAATIAVTAMKANQFVVLGMTRTYWDFYRGMGLGVSIFLTVEGVVFWQLASLAKTDAHALRPILAMFAIGYLAFAVNSYAYFFMLPVIVEIAIVLCLGLSWFTAGSTTRT